MATKYCPHHKRRKVESDYVYCFDCRQRHREYRKRFQQTTEFLVKQRLRRRVMEMKREAGGLCKICGKEPAAPIYCISCLKRRSDRNYKKRGKFTARRSESKTLNDQLTLARLQYEMGDNWADAKAWVKEHIEVFVEPRDRTLWLSRAFNVGEDFAIESTSD